MLETKLETIHPVDYSHEEQMINDYACFGRVLALRSVTNKTVDGNTSDIAHNLTFQRDFNIPNKDKLDNMFLRYTVKKNDIQKAADAVAIPMRKYVFWFLIVTAVCCAILFPTVYPAMLDILWQPDVGEKIIFALLVLMFAAHEKLTGTAEGV
jgi:hypothetical protein